MSTVLVTGGSGFLGAHVVLQLLAAGHTVRTTVRALTREAEVRAMLAAGGASAGDRLTFFAADLMNDAGWAEAAAGCEFVQHVASPFPLGVPRHENDLIIPAREGTLRVLKAARAAGVRRVVLTSSFAAIGYGHGRKAETFDETSWTNVNGADVDAYPKSKTLAERAAWDYVAGEGAGLELAVVNPVAILGPVLGRDYSTSIALVQNLLTGRIPGLPNVSFGLVDVRDVADLHLRAMTAAEARGERFLAVAGDFISVAEVAAVLRQRLPSLSARVPTRRLPDWLVRTLALANPSARAIATQLGLKKNATAEKAKRLLGWSPRSREDAIVATAESLAQLGLLAR